MSDRIKIESLPPGRYLFLHIEEKTEFGEIQHHGLSVVTISISPEGSLNYEIVPFIAEAPAISQIDGTLVIG